MSTVVTRRQSNPIDADVKRRVDEFFTTNPALAKKLDEFDRLLMGHFLQAQLQEERNGWRASLAKVMGELERLRKLALKAGGAAPEDTAEEYQLRRQFTEIMEVQEIDSEPSNAQQTEDSEKAPEQAPFDEATHRLQAQLGEAHREANAAKELAWNYENLIHELKAINARLEARLTQLVLERQRCFKLLPPTQGGQENGDLYKAIRELQNRQEQLTREQHEELKRLHQEIKSSSTATENAVADSQQKQQPTQHICATCGSALSSTPRSDGPPQQQQQQDEKQQQLSNAAAIGWKHQRGVGRQLSKPIDVAIVPLRPKWQQLQQQQQQQKPVVDQTPAVVDSSSAQLQERLTEAQEENGHLLRELHSLVKALRAAEDDAKEKTERLTAYEKQVASMKHAYTYRQQEPATVAEIVGVGGSSLPVLNLRQTQKRSSQQLLQQQQQQPPLSERQYVMPAKTSVTRCLRCQKLYRLVDNNKFACKYHSKGKQKREQHNSLGKLADVLFVWDCCGRLANAEGCCYSEHI